MTSIGRWLLVLVTVTTGGWMSRAAAQVGRLSQPLLTVQKGALPIILSAPHGGRKVIEGVPARQGDGAKRFTTVRDENTAELAQQLANALAGRLGARPYLVIAQFARKNVDPNRPAADAYEAAAAKPYYDAYHAALAEACREVQQKWGRGLLLDLHGQAAEGDAIFRGTAGGITVARLTARFGRDAVVGPKSILGQLESHGYRVIPGRASPQKEDARFNGGHIVRTYGGAQGPGLDALQLELGTQLRVETRLARTADDLAAAIQVFAKTYLP